MAKEKKEKKKPNNKIIQFSDLPCGAVPTKPGLGAGDWQCRDGKWVWVEDIGG